MGWEAGLEWKGKRTSEERALSSVGWGTPDFKLKGWNGKLDLSGKGRGLWKEGRCLVSGGVHQFLNSRVGMGSWTSEGKVKRTSEGRSLSSIGCGTPNFKLKGWDGKLDFGRKSDGDFERKGAV